MRLAQLLEGPTVAQAMQRPYDNFAVLRLALALAVVVSHAFSVTTGDLHGEPLTVSTGFTLGEHAVNGFFAISGFLVTMSYDRRGPRDYLVARTLRIAPGLVVATLATGLLLGAALTSLPLADYFTDRSLWGFISATLTNFKSNTALPGVFTDNPFRFPMGTVWTLKYEVLCYAGVLVLGWCGILRHRLAGAGLVLVLFVATMGLDLLHPDASKGMQTALRLPLIFATGGLIYLYRDQMRVSAALLAGLVVATWLADGTFLYRALLFVTEAYGVIWLALAPGLAHPKLEPRADLSYGTYLYGWPVQQALHALFPAVAALPLLVPSLALTLAVAALSWFLVEKPALALKARVLAWRRAPRPA